MVSQRDGLGAVSSHLLVAIPMVGHMPHRGGQQRTHYNDREFAMKIARSTTLTLVAALAVTACSDGRYGNSADTDRALDAQGTTGSMSGTGVMDGRQDMQGRGTNAMTEQVQADLRRMDGAGANDIQALVPAHRQTVTNMIAQFRQDMRGRSSSDNANFTATIDSVERDLQRMQGMSAQELQRLMPDHSARVRRLMDTHGTTMGYTMR